MDCIPPGSSVHGIFQARVLEWGSIAMGSRSDGEKSIEIALCCFRTNEDSQLLAPTSEVSLPSVICPAHLRMGQVVTAADSVCWWGS